MRYIQEHLKQNLEKLHQKWEEFWQNKKTKLILKFSKKKLFKNEKQNLQINLDEIEV